MTSGWGFDRAQAQWDNAQPAYLDDDAELDEDDGPDNGRDPDRRHDEDDDEIGGW